MLGNAIIIYLGTRVYVLMHEMGLKSIWFPGEPQTLTGGHMKVGWTQKRVSWGVLSCESMSFLLNQSSLPKFISAYGLLFYLRRRQMRHLGWGWRCSDSPLEQDSPLTAISTCFFSIIISHFTFHLCQVSEKKSRRPRRIRRLPEASARLGSPAPTEDAHRRVRDGHVPNPARNADTCTHGYWIRMCVFARFRFGSFRKLESAGAEAWACPSLPGHLIHP